MEAGLAGRADRLKGYTVATEVFGRDETFDPQTDPIVRMEIGRVRQDLEHYYFTSGRDDPVQISIPKGGNAPMFEGRFAESSVAEGPERTPARPRGAEATRRPSWRWIAVFGAGLVLGAGLLWLRPLSTSRETEATPVGTAGRQTDVRRGPTIAVLPFHNLSGDPEQEYFADGITEQTVTGLGRFHKLFVLSRQSTLKYKGRPAEPQQIGQDLGADYLLEGSVGRTADTIHITARLVDTRSGGLMWAESYRRELRPEEVFDVLEEIASRVSGALGGTHDVYGSALATARGGQPRSMDAYECMFRYLSMGGARTPEGHQRSRACLEDVVSDDPDYADGWTVLSLVYVVEHLVGLPPGPGEYDPLSRSVEYAQRAVSLAPGSAAAHGVLAVGRFHQHDLGAFRRGCERARELNPNDSETLARCGKRLAFMGDWDRGLAWLKEAMALNPQHYGSHYLFFAMYHYDRGEYEQALEQAFNAQLPDFFWYQAVLGMTLGQLERRAEARAAVDRLIEVKPDIREDFWRVTHAWNAPDSLVERFASGLRKAGLDLAPRPADPVS